MQYAVLIWSDSLYTYTELMAAVGLTIQIGHAAGLFDIYYEICTARE